MQDFPSLYVFKCHAQLHKPVHDLSLSEEISFCPPLFDVEWKISNIAEFHNNDENALIYQTAFICNNIRMGKSFQ